MLPSLQLSFASSIEVAGSSRPVTTSLEIPFLAIFVAKLWALDSSEGRTYLLRLDDVSLMYIITAHSLYRSGLLGGSRGIELKGRGSDI